MDSQGGEGNNNQSPPATNEAVAAQPTGPVQAPADTPEGQFEKQFGSGSTKPPVADDATVPGLIDTALAKLGTTPPAEKDSINKNNNQPLPETPQQPEQTPASKLEQQISDAVKEFLDAQGINAQGEKVTTS